MARLKQTARKAARPVPSIPHREMPAKRASPMRVSAPIETPRPTPKKAPQKKMSKTERVFTVEDIRAVRLGRNNQELEYFVKWQKYPSRFNTWEPIKSFKDRAIVDEFWDSIQALRQEELDSEQEDSEEQEMKPMETSSPMTDKAEFEGHPETEAHHEILFPMHDTASDVGLHEERGLVEDSEQGE